MRRWRRIGRVVWALWALSLAGGAAAQSLIDMLPRADRQEVRDFALNEARLQTLIGVIHEAHALGIKPVSSSQDPDNRRSLAAIEAYVLALDPRIGPMLARHGTTMHEMLLTRIAMGQAAYALEAQQHPELGDKPQLEQMNTANIRFYEAHLGEISRFLNEQAEAQDSTLNGRP